MPATSISSASSLESRSGAKPPSSPDRGRQPALVQRALERVEDLGAHPQALARSSARRTGTTMNSWKSTLLSACAPPFSTFIIGTGSTRARLAAEVAPQRQALLGGRGVGRGERHAEDRVRPEPRLVGRAVELDQRAVEARLVGRVEAARRPRRSPRRRSQPRASTPLPAQARRRRAARSPRTRRSRRPRAPRRAARAGGEPHVHLDRRVAATVEDLPGVDLLDRAHLCPLMGIRSPAGAGLSPCSSCPRRRCWSSSALCTACSWRPRIRCCIPSWTATSF